MPEITVGARGYIGNWAQDLFRRQFPEAVSGPLYAYYDFICRDKKHEIKGRAPGKYTYVERYGSIMVEDKDYDLDTILWIRYPELQGWYIARWKVIKPFCILENLNRRGSLQNKKYGTEEMRDGCCYNIPKRVFVFAADSELA
jgi:hypothetical protein